MAAELVCPLCKQPVTKALYDKITVIWVAKQEAVKKYKIETQRLKKKKFQLIKEFRNKEQALRKANRQKLLVAVKQKTSVLNARISKLQQSKLELEKKAEMRINKAIHTAENRERQRATKRESQLRRQLSIETKRAVRAAQLRTKEMQEIKANQRVIKLERSRDAARKQMSSFQKMNDDQRKRIKNLERQLAKETTPQIEGLLYEHTLHMALKKEFPNDQFDHTGKGGDIIHRIIHKKAIAGTIVYECKRVLHFQKAHVIQTANAKLKRNAEFAILVTSAKKKGKYGFFVEHGVLVVHPAGVLPLVKILRGQLIRIADMKLGKKQRDEAARKTIEYLESAEFTNSLDTVIDETKQLYEELKGEIKSHLKVWKKRHTSYGKMHQEAVRVKGKTLALLTGRSDKEKFSDKEKYPELPDLTEK